MFTDSVGWEFRQGTARLFLSSLQYLRFQLEDMKTVSWNLKVYSLAYLLVPASCQLKALGSPRGPFPVVSAWISLGFLTVWWLDSRVSIELQRESQT